MFKFFLKKNFCDHWDNLIHLFLSNLLVYAAGVLAVLSFLFLGKDADHAGIKNIVGFFMLIIFCMIISILVFAEGENVAKIADFESARYRDYFKGIVPNLKDGALFGIFTGLLVAVAFVSLPYYYNMFANNRDSGMAFVWLLFDAVIFWFLLITLLAMQWFVPIKNLIGDGFIKCLKKSYIVFFDNTLFSIGVALVNLVNILITVFTFGLVPGMSGILLTNTDAFRLRLYKYDWLEVNPDLSPKERKQVPWADLLEKDKKTLGPRPLKSFFAPWKQ